MRQSAAAKTATKVLCIWDPVEFAKMNAEEGLALGAGFGLLLLVLKFRIN